MTKVRIEFALTGPLDDKLMERISDAHGNYGMTRVIPTPALDGLTVEYDASRLTRDEVEQALRQAGLPVVKR
jgi:hypothetical protein